MNPSMSRCREDTPKSPGLVCGLTLEAVADSYGPRAESSGLEKASALTVLVLNLFDVDPRYLLSPCQARESGLPIAASPVPAPSPHSFRGVPGRATNRSTLGRTTECCQTPDVLHANVVAANRWLSATADFLLSNSSQHATAPNPAVHCKRSCCPLSCQRKMSYTPMLTTYRNTAELQGWPCLDRPVDQA
ncbi:uncharacterized protein M421DRAFT_93236 [Didymella exigua CBS 183.55]|uniref:Uncharacterized protein n=1 Tax=Didymella exigua CBS 183.55 TaxID=1150837 RepID=A0A6A5RPC9_9PLEO|nr:uncharacterized protein M421DRAFT_93236 [Didymella exigua CBS 183.55]KAF1927367.1 hypothetical protein M421DRAFT_93236 [Didymella exigua CBS 183.55]